MSRTYLTTKRLAELERTLSPRDWTVLATLARVRLATGKQLERLCYTGLTPRRAQQALAALAARRLVARLPRVIGGVRAGSTGHVYTLDVAGRRLALRDLRRAQRPWSIGQPFLAHSLDITELYTRLVEADRAGTLELRDFVSEPASWRTFAGPGGARAVLKPDAYVVVRLGEFEDHWFIEVDRGSESAPTLARKCDTYRRYWQTGAEQATHELFPKVLWLVPDHKRQDVLVDVFGRQPVAAWELFRVGRFDEAVTRIALGTQA
jgi:protein involved in plasmid replication-relaxation